MIDMIHSDITTLAFGMPGGPEWIILLVLGLLIFGRRLPEVGRSLGKGIVEFKKGINGIEDQIDDASVAKSPGKLTEASHPKLDEQPMPGAAESSESADATVGSEGENPYRPKQEDVGNG